MQRLIYVSQHGLLEIDHPCQENAGERYLAEGSSLQRTYNPPFFICQAQRMLMARLISKHPLHDPGGTRNIARKGRRGRNYGGRMRRSWPCPTPFMQVLDFKDLLQKGRSFDFKTKLPDDCTYLDVPTTRMIICKTRAT